ncbi:MAG: cysteine hydrolase [Thermodesulfobacteria bacterium]|nr:cysteine hydrolase [Thermodesulfobacteriota bacterium]
MDKYTAPDILRSALVTIDTQNDFVLPGAPAEIPGSVKVIPNMVGILRECRKKGVPIIHVVRLYLPDGSNADLCRRGMIESGKKIVTPGSDGAELVDDLKPHQFQLDPDILLAGKFQQIGTSEFVIYKPRWGAFYKTDLEDFLKSMEINTLIFTGCNFPNCPRTTIYEASERDFRVVLVEDAVSGLNQKGVEEMEAIGVQMMTTSQFLECLKAR